jgi:hypothetical protein
LLDALLEAYPHAVYSPYGKLKLIAHSRAADLRRLGWDVQSVSRRDTNGGLEHGYVLRTPSSVAYSQRVAASRHRPMPYDEKLERASLVAARVGLTMEQLRYLDRIGSVPFDVVSGSGARYLPATVRLLTALGVLHRRGIGLDTGLDLLTRHADELAMAVRLAAPEREEIVA